MMRRGGSVGPPDPYQSRASPGYYYSRSSGPNSAPPPQQQQPIPSPSHSQHSHQRLPMSQPIVRRAAVDYRDPMMTPRSAIYDHQPHQQPHHQQQRIEDMTPSYYVEHLATFAVGRQFGVAYPADGIRKLKQMEKNSAIWAQPLILRFRQSSVTVEDENGELVEQFPLDLIDQPTAHVSSDSRDTYNNILLFVVREDRKRSSTPTEMHIFQCNRVSATEVADDLQAYVRGQFRRVRNGRRSSQPPPMALQQAAMPYYPPDDASISSETSEMFERDVNTLNRCFDDIERFVARIQSAALAQREIEQQNYRYRTANRRDKKGGGPPPPDPNGILYMRAQLPIESEFVEIFKKFKLSFNLLAKLKNHIHEPNAPELLHFLFTPLSVILEACHWGLGRNIAPSVHSPLISIDARELMQNCLTSRESDVWMSLGESWRTPPEDWRGNLPPPYRPVFVDGFAPYGVADRVVTTPNPLHRGQSAPPEHYRQPRERNVVDTAPNTPMTSTRTPKPRPQRNMSVDNLELDRLTLERERLEFEKAKIAERENRLRAEEKQIEDEKRRLNAEKDLIKKEAAKDDKRYDPPLSSPAPAPRAYNHVKVAVDTDTSPRQQAFIDDVIGRGGKLVVATFDRSGQNPKELTVHRGEYLEVLYDEKNWWECKNMHQRVGYVPHTILSMVPLEQQQYASPKIGSAYSGPNGHSSNTIPSQHGPGNHHRPPLSDAAIQVSFQPAVSTAQAQPAQPTYIPPAPPAPQAPSFEDMLKMQQLKNQQAQLLRLQQEQQQKNQQDQQIQQQQNIPPPAPQASTDYIPQIYNPNQNGLTVSRRNPSLVNELSQTLGRTEANKILRPTQANRTSTVSINEKSSPDDVRIWLQDKGFSLRVIDLLDGQDGANLFSLNKMHLQQACGREEGSYLYSQLLVQKKRSGYRTHTADELKAILTQRKTRVDLTNETPADEPTFVINNDY